MKIALVYGKGRDGCGVQKIGTEMQRWVVKQPDHSCDFYSLEERVFIRGKFNSDEYIGFKYDEIEATAAKLETYDVVIFHSYPSLSHENKTIKSFYENIIKIKNPIKVMFMHELTKMNIDRIPFIVPILNEADMIYTFGVDTVFSTRAKAMLKSKKDRIKKFSMMIDFSSLEKLRRPVSELKAQLTYIGRYSSIMKDPLRVLELAPMLWEHDINPLIMGCETSIEMAREMLGHPNKPILFRTHLQSARDNMQMNIDKVHAARKSVPIIGAFAFDWGMPNFATNSMFGCSFYSLAKDPAGYCDRMEYTQIEIIGMGLVPVFDKHWGEHNHTPTGERFIDVPYSAVYSDRNDLQDTVDKLVRIRDNPELIEKYREVSLQLIKDCYDVNTIMPKLLAEITTLGKDTKKYKSVPKLLKDKKAFNLEDYFKTTDKMIVVLGFNEIENDYTRFIEVKSEVEANHVVDALGFF